jgi:two-component system sensor histidine kinase BaeS
LRTLRLRLILSHVLPLLLIVPLMGIALVYTLETRVPPVNLTRELEAQAVLFAEVANDHSEIWQDRSEAQDFLARFGPRLTPRAMLLTPNGQILASTDPADAQRLGQHLVSFDPADVLNGRIVIHTYYGGPPDYGVAGVLVPVMGGDSQVVGLVRLSRQEDALSQWFVDARRVIFGVLAIGLLAGSVTGLLLALNVERPLRRVTAAIREFSNGQELHALPEEGPREIRTLVQAFNSLVKRLEDQEEARHQLLAGLVHELGRPLGAVYSAVQALEAGTDQDLEWHQQMLEGTKKELERLQRLVADLTHLEERVLGTLELHSQRIDLATWLPQVLTPWREAAHSKNLQWQEAIEPSLPTLWGDPDRLAQAVGNLLSNAIKYTAAGGTIHVGADVSQQAICISVEDTGPGIAPQEQELIFAPFYRARTGRRFPQGMGLGLTIARDVVIAHGGRLELHSAPRQGSRFAIYLPLASAKEQDGPDQPTAGPATGDRELPLA